MALFGKNDAPSLTSIDATGRSRTHRLTKPKYTIGSNKRCTIQIVGDYVSELHATVDRQADGRWVLTNNSPDGTYLNETKVESDVLNHGSVIQIGTGCRLEFSGGVNAANQLGSNGSKDNSSKKEKKKIGKWHLIIGGMVIVYLPLFLYLHNMTKNIAVTGQEDIFSVAMINEAIEESHNYLNSLPGSGSGAKDSVRVGEGLSADYYLLTSLNDLDSAKRKELIDSILGKANRYLTNAHGYHMMALPNNAISELQKVMQLVPDHRNPVTGFAARSIANIQFQAQ